MQQSTACLHFRGVQRRCVWAARRSCLHGLRRGGGGRQAGVTDLLCIVWRCELTAGQVRSGVGVRPAVALRRPIHFDTDRTQNAPVWRSGRLSSHRHNTHDKTVLSVCVVSGVDGDVN